MEGQKIRVAVSETGDVRSTKCQEIGQKLEEEGMKNWGQPLDGARNQRIRRLPRPSRIDFSHNAQRRGR